MVLKHTQEDRIYRSDNQSLFHRTPPSLHVGIHLHSRPIYSLQQQREKDEEECTSMGGRKQIRKRRTLQISLALHLAVSDASAAFSC